MTVLISNSQRKIRLNRRGIERDCLLALSTLGLGGAELSLLFVSPARMRALNLRYRGIDKETDVLSFPAAWPPHKKGALPPEPDYPFAIGDIVINPSRALKQAKENGLTLDEEIKRLLVHGLLHLMGYDHEKGGAEERRMRRKEREVLKRKKG